MGFVDSVTGDIQKARLMIIDKSDFNEMRRRGESREPNRPLAGENNQGQGNGNGLGRNETNIPVNRKDLQYGEDGTANSYTENQDHIKAKYFTVQFNPSEITITGRAGGYMPQKNFIDENDRQTVDELKMGGAALKITLSTRLIFDKVVPGDAFTGFTSTSFSAAAQRASSLIANRSSQDDYQENKFILDKHSVRGEVESLIAAVRNEQTRLINFRWGDTLDYTGYLNNINATYVMFNTNAEPIRAYVDLSLVIADEKSEDIKYLADNEWYRKYKRAFEKDISYVNASQNVGSLINI